ncbi:hypothetical protein ABZ345_44145 [Lentzea sp. NPDC005914]|uniref:hypothetical protein n=1 Tax=Lentzea sp. NPDC005914 TaxID=3154572 RepID=UPI0033C5DBE9
MGALLVPLAILAGAAFDSVTKAPDAVAKVIESVGAGEPDTVIVTTTVAIPARQEGSSSASDAVAAPDAVATASAAEPQAVAAPPRTMSEALAAEPCVTARGTGSHASKEPPVAGMSVTVLPGRSGENRDGDEKSRPGRPARCG